MSSPLEQLPLDVFRLICEYVLLVEYGEEEEQVKPGKRAPYILKVTLRRGYALAACSRKCHMLAEQVAEQFYNEGVPQLQFSDDKGEEEDSFLRRFYVIKDAECKFRSNLRSLNGSLKRIEYGSRNGVENERLLAEQALQIVYHPVVRSWWPQAHQACMNACQIALRFGERYRYSSNPRLLRWAAESSAGLQHDARVKVTVEKVMDRIYRLIAALPASLSSRYYRSISIELLEILYVQSAASYEDSWLDITAANLCRERAIRLAIDRDLKGSAWVQTVRFKMYWALIDYYRRTARIAESFDTVERAREDTQCLDPINLYTLASIAAKHAGEYGLDRSEDFVAAARLKLEEAYPDDFCWLEPNSDSGFKHRLLANYRRDCSAWLRSLEEMH